MSKTMIASATCYVQSHSVWEEQLMDEDAGYLASDLETEDKGCSAGCLAVGKVVINDVLEDLTFSWEMLTGTP